MNNQLIVSKLRPMREAPMNTWILIYDGERFFQTKMRAGTKLLKNFSEEFEGWIPIPQYKPEP